MPSRLAPSSAEAFVTAAISSIRCIALGVFLLLLLVCVPSLNAELPSIRLLTVFPSGGTVGARFEVGVSGADLDDASRLHFSHPGITSDPKTNAASGTPEPNRFLVSINASVPPGVYEARIAGRFGISNPRAFAVDLLPELASPSTNTSPAASILVPLGSIINGHSEPNSSGFFKFAARKGQRIWIDCKAREIDSRMDPALVLTDALGKELLQNRLGGPLDFMVPADGEFHLKVYDYLFRGGVEYFYRLSVSAGPRVEYIFPPSGLAGAKARFTVYGWNLPAGTPAKEVARNGQPLERIDIEMELPPAPKNQSAFASLKAPADVVLDTYDYRLSSTDGLSNPVKIHFATGPVITEQEPDDLPDQAQRINPPCELVGRFYPQGDRDWVSFDARKGDVYWVEVFSQRLGLPTDPFVLIQRVSKNDKGVEVVSDVKEMYDTDSNIGGADYATGSRDPSGRFEADADGAYRVQIRDLFNTSKADPRLDYRLSIRRESPDFRLLAVAQTPPPLNKDSKEALVWAPFVRRGETIPVRVMAIRRDGYNGDIQLQAEGLPPGVTCSEGKIEKDKSTAILLLTASESATGWVGAVRITGKARIGDTDVSREAVGSTVTWTVPDYNTEAVRSRLTRDFQLGVSGLESAPISIESSEAKVWEAPAGGKLKIPLRITRRSEFGANLKLKVLGVPEFEKIKELEVDGKATNATVELDLAELKLAAGTYRMNLQTQTSGKYRNNPEAAKAAAEALQQIEKTISELNTAIKAAPGVRQMAEKASADATAKAKAAAEILAKAAKSAAESEALAKSADEKLLSTKPGLEANPAAAELIVERESSMKSAEEARLLSKTALEAKSAAEKAHAEAQQLADASLAALRAAEKFEAEAPATLKDAEKSREPASNRVKETSKIAEPRDVNITVYSAPILVKVAPAVASNSK